MSNIPTSPPNALAARFQCADGNARLIEALCDQFIVRGEQKLAEELANIGELLEIQFGHRLIEQDGCDDDLYLIISGSFDILVNQRVTASRTTGMHVGEMAVIDSTSRRSATVEAAEAALVLKIKSKDFECIASRYPQVWRRLATELSRRLKQRNKFHNPPRGQPVVFIGSTVEGLAIAREIQEGFNHDPFVVKVWEKGIFSPGATPIEDLLKITGECDFGIVVVTPDDKVESRGQNHDAPRDNVIFELGLLIGSIGRYRTFIVRPRKIDLKIPTDLLGVTPITFDAQAECWKEKEIPVVVNQMRKLILEKGPI